MFKLNEGNQQVVLMPTSKISNVTGQSLIAFDEFGPITSSTSNNKRKSAATLKKKEQM